MMAERKKRSAPSAFLAAARERNANWHLLPKCGAIAKRSGTPCQQAAMANGRCRYHGGKTPKGKDWHRISKPDSAAKAEVKLEVVERRIKARAKRLARMTDEERAAHKEWQKTHAPGAPEAREARRALLKQNAEARKILAQSRPAPPADKKPGDGCCPGSAPASAPVLPPVDENDPSTWWIFQ
jgi:hypothetical protein